MKKIILIIVLLVILIISSIYVSNKLTNDAKNIDDKASIMEENIQNEKWDEAIKGMEELVKEWEKTGDIWAVIAEHEDIENAMVALKRSQAFLENKEKEEAIAELRQFRYMLEHIPGTHNLNLKNIL